MWKALLPLLLMLAPAVAGAAQPPVHGQPLQQRFGVEQHDGDPVSYDVLGLADGSILVANGAGVLHFDGSHWTLIELPGLSPARALLQDADGQILVAGYDQFGRLERDTGGRLVYLDLRGEFGVDGEQATFGVIWEIVANAQGVYFRSDESLFFRAADGRREQWPLGLEYRRLFAVGDRLLTRRHGHGLGHIDAQGFDLLPGGEAFAERPLSMVFDRDGELLLVSDDGLFLASAEGIRPLPGSASEALRERGPGAGLGFADGSYLLGTDRGELIHVGAGLDLIAVHELGSYSVLDLALDREGGVWAATEGDLVRLRLPSPWSAFTTRDGLGGSTLDTAYFDASLWIATSAGVFRSLRQDGKVAFELAIPTALEANALLAVEDGLLIGDRDGLLWHHGSPRQSLRLLQVDSVFDLVASAHHPGRVYVLAAGSIQVLQREGPGWQRIAEWPLGEISIGVLLEESPELLWVDDWRGVPQRWRIDPYSAEVLERQRFGREAGIEWDPALGTALYQLDDRLYAVSGTRVYRRRGERFEAFAGLPFSLFDRPFDVGLSETAHGAFAYSERQLYRRLPGTADWQLVPLGAGVARGFFGMQTDADGKLRIKTWGGVLQFDPEVAEPPLVPLAVSLAGWRLRRADGSEQTLPLRGADALRLSAGDLLRFDFSMPTMEQGVEFRQRIDGLDAAWSSWSDPTRPALGLRAPPPGNYRLQVEGRTRSGRLGAPLVFEFTVQPNWWQTGWARLLALCALLLGLLLVAQLIARLRYRQVLANQRQLEARITERTAELEQANRKLAELATEDSLTGVANRRALEQALMREWERCGELGQPLSLIMLDVDHFKQFNDRHGHLEGDQQLVRVAGELAALVRPVRELLARFGGEEFALVLPGVALEEALERAEHMRQAFDHPGFPTTVSLGVACMLPRPGGNATDLLRAADQALYAAKRQGRNRVCAAPQT